MPIDQSKLQNFLGKFVGDLGGVTTIAMVALAHELGLYRAMDGKGPLDATELAAASGCNRRLIQEWLDQQAAAGYVTFDKSSGRYELPPEHGFALAQTQSPAYVTGGSLVVSSMFHDLDRVVAAFRGDGGVPWGDHHPNLFRGTAEFFRPGYQSNLTASWIPALDGVEARLKSGIHVADIGCGHGISSIVMAQAYPASAIRGFDYHAPSIDVARDAARTAGIAERVQFAVARANAFEGRFDLICFFDCLHDMGDPVGIAKHARTRLNDGGTVMLVEPFAHDDRAVNHSSPQAKVFYGASTFICTPNSLSQEVGRAMGAQAGEVGMRAVFTEAGYSHFRRVTETPFNIVYEARA
jgi:SAM-dependent methyltransferase